MKKNKLVSRMIQMCVVLIGISFLTFLLTYLAPGDPATAMYDSLGITPSPEMLEQARASMGLDKPFLQQYVDWIGGIFHGDFGISFSKNVPVLELLMKRLPATFRLALLFSWADAGDFSSSWDSLSGQAGWDCGLYRSFSFLPWHFTSGLPDWLDIIVCIRFEAWNGKGGKQYHWNRANAVAGDYTGHRHGVQIFQSRCVQRYWKNCIRTM